MAANSLNAPRIRASGAICCIRDPVAGEAARQAAARDAC
jgi:hypothetical protein